MGLAAITGISLWLTQMFLFSIESAVPAATRRGFHSPAFQKMMGFQRRTIAMMGRRIARFHKFTLHADFFCAVAPRQLYGGASAIADNLSNRAKISQGQAISPIDDLTIRQALHRASNQ